MTFLGKILVVVQLVLSVLFVGFAAAVYNYHISWQKEADELRGQLQTAQQATRDTQSELDDVRSQSEAKIKAETDRANTLEAENTGLEQQLALLNQDLQNVRTERDTLLAEAAIAVDEAQHRVRETSEQRDVNQKLYARVDELIGYVQQLEDQIFTQDVASKELTAKHQRILEQLANITEQARRIRAAGGAEPSATATTSVPPNVEGEITSVRLGVGTTPTIVQINIGSDDGLEEGHLLYVYRLNGETKYLGQIRLTLVTPDAAAGEMVNAAKNGIVESGDQVATTIVSE